jgi:hypothetical protein
MARPYARHLSFCGFSFMPWTPVYRGERGHKRDGHFRATDITEIAQELWSSLTGKGAMPYSVPVPADLSNYYVLLEVPRTRRRYNAHPTRRPYAPPRHIPAC